MNFSNIGLKTRIAIRAALVFAIGWAVFIVLWQYQLREDFFTEQEKQFDLQNFHLDNIIDTETKSLSANLRSIAVLAASSDGPSRSDRIGQAVSVLSLPDAIRMYQYYDPNGDLLFSSGELGVDILSNAQLNELTESPAPANYFSCSTICYLNAVMPMQAAWGFLRVAVPIDVLLNKFQVVSNDDLFVLYRASHTLSGNRLGNYTVDSHTRFSARKVFFEMRGGLEMDKAYGQVVNDRLFFAKTLTHKLNHDVIFVLLRDVTESQHHFYRSLWQIILVSFIILVATLLLVYVLLNQSLSHLGKLTGIMKLIGQSHFREANRQLTSHSREKAPEEIRLIYETTYHLVDQLEETHSSLKYLAEHDSLTGLGTRKKLSQHLAELSDPVQHQYALVGLDLDYFKTINDKLGHAAGDRLLVRVADVLRDMMGGQGLAGRIGGDEFMVVLPYEHQDELFQHLYQLREAISQISIAQYSINNVSISIGVALFPDHTSNVEQLIIYSDAAMYENKRYKRQPFHLYSGNETLMERERERQYWNTFIIKSLQNETIQAHFQPVFSTKDQQAFAFEALARFYDPDTGEGVMPGQVIPHAEQSHSIIQIDRQMIKLAFAKAMVITPVPTMMLNLSNVSIASTSMGQYILDMLEAYQFPAEKLILEITESSEIADTVQVVNFIEDLRNRGVRFALDDFGAGFSSFFYLKTLRVDYLKIDQKIIEGLLEEEADHHIMRAIALLAREFNIKTIAEGIENPELLAVVRGYDVDYVQGFQLAKPSAEALEIYARSEGDVMTDAGRG